MNLLMVVGIAQGESPCGRFHVSRGTESPEGEASSAFKKPSSWRLREGSLRRVPLRALEQADRTTRACDEGTPSPCPMPAPEYCWHY